MKAHLLTDSCRCPGYCDGGTVGNAHIDSPATVADSHASSLVCGVEMDLGNQDRQMSAVLLGHIGRQAASQAATQAALLQAIVQL